MRIRHSVTSLFLALILPAVCLAVAGYFGVYTIWGERGLQVLEATDARLGLQEETLTETSAQRARLAHRVQLMEQPHPDPDLVEELARRQLMDGAPGQVAVPRTAH